MENKILTEEEFKKLSPKEQEQVVERIKSILKTEKELAEEEGKIPQMSMKEFEDYMKGTMEKLIGQMTPTDKKFFMFPGIGLDGKDDTTPEGKYMKTKKFFKALVGHDTKMLNAMHEETRVAKNLSEGTTTAGGFLVPEEFRAEIMRLAPIYGVIRRDCRVIPMRYDTLNIPAAGTTDQSAIWTNEAAQIKQTDPTFRQLTLTINKLAAIPSVTNELLDDANVDVLNYLAMIIAEAFASEEDNQGFNGSGSPFVGLLKATGVPTTPLASGTAITMLSYPDFVKATTNIYGNATQGAKFYMHRSVRGHLISRIASTGNPIFSPDQQSLAGYPWVDAERMPATTHSSASVGTFPFIVFGNLQRALAMGERGSMQMKLGTEGTVGSNNLFEKDMVALRVVERIAMGVLLPSAITRITT